MLDKVLNDFLDHCKNREIISQYFTRDLIEHIVECENLEGEVQSIEFKNKASSYASFSVFNQSIVVDRQQQARDFLKPLNKNVYQLTQEEATQLNLEFLKTIIHELEHAKQSAKHFKNTNENDTVANLIGDNFNRIYQKNSLLTVDHYEDIPIEHNAELQASIYINNLIKNNEFLNSMGFKNNELAYINYLINYAYNKNALVERYLDITKQDIKNYDFESLTDSEKLLYGFPVSKEILDNKEKVLKIVK